MSLSLCLTVSLSLCLTVSLSLCLSLSLSVSLCLFCLSLSFCLSLISLSLSASLSKHTKRSKNQVCSLYFPSTWLSKQWVCTTYVVHTHCSKNNGIATNEKCRLQFNGLFHYLSTNLKQFLEFEVQILNW